MIIFLHGPDDYRREQKKKWYVNEFEKKYSGLNVRYFYLAEADKLDELKSFARGQSIFEEKKLAVVENLREADEKLAADVLCPLANQKTTVVLFSEDDAARGALAFLLEKPATVEKFDYLRGSELAAFIKNAVKERVVNLDAGALEFLAEVYKDNTWGLITELDKAANLGKDLVTKLDFEDLGLEAMPEFWATMNGLKNPNLAQRLATLEKIFARNEPPPKIFNILSSLWREKIPQMAEYDLMVKSGKLEYEEALVDLAIS